MNELDTLKKENAELNNELFTLKNSIAKSEHARKILDTPTYGTETTSGKITAGLTNLLNKQAK